MDQMVTETHTGFGLLCRWAVWRRAAGLLKKKRCGAWACGCFSCMWRTSVWAHLTGVVFFVSIGSYGTANHNTFSKLKLQACICTYTQLNPMASFRIDSVFAASSVGVCGVVARVLFNSAWIVAGFLLLAWEQKQHFSSDAPAIPWQHNVVWHSRTRNKM